MEYLLLIAGLTFLILGAEFLVKGAVAIAYKFRVSMLVIGMTIVSFGTSAPELLVMIKAALSGHEDIGVGTVVGSNISNIALILGFTALLIPIHVQKDSIRIDWPMMMAATILFYLFIQDNVLVFWEGLLFVSILIVFGVWIVRKSRSNYVSEIDPEEFETKLSDTDFILRNVALVILGSVGLVYGSDFLLDGSITIARDFGVPERVIGLTLIAFGTSVPELITSVVAAYHKKADISVGNLIGSNLFNILFILGTTSMITDIPIANEIIENDVLWLIAISILLFPIMFLGRKINRFEGSILLLAYGSYIYFALF